MLPEPKADQEKAEVLPIKPLLIPVESELVEGTSVQMSPTKTYVDPIVLQANPIRPSLIPVESELVEGTSVQKSPKKTETQTTKPETVELKKKYRIYKEQPRPMLPEPKPDQEKAEVPPIKPHPIEPLLAVVEAELAKITSEQMSPTKTNVDPIVTTC